MQRTRARCQRPAKKREVWARRGSGGGGGTMLPPDRRRPREPRRRPRRRGRARSRRRSRPPRPSGGGDPFGELVRFGSDRTARLRSGLSSAAADADGAGTAAAATAAASDGMSAKLDRMYRNFYSSSSFSSPSAEPRSFASHLRSQHEFGNPDLFPSVVKHCGIDPMGTNVRARADWKPQDFEMVGRLVEAEERARAASAGGGGTHLALGQDGHPSLAPLDNN